MKTNELEVEINGNKVTIALTDEQIKKLQTQQKEWYDGRVFDEMYMPIGTVDGIAVVDISEYKGGKDMTGAGFEPQRIFVNKNHAICATEYINLFIEMYNFCQLRNGNNKIDWTDSSKFKFGVVYNKGLSVELYSSFNSFVFGLAVLTEEHAEEMLSIFSDRIKEVYSKLQNY